MVKTLNPEIAVPTMLMTSDVVECTRVASYTRNARRKLVKGVHPHLQATVRLIPELDGASHTFSRGSFVLVSQLEGTIRGLPHNAESHLWCKYYNWIFTEQGTIF